MANIPSNFGAAVVSGSGSITGSYSGFTVVAATVFTGLKDGNNSTLAATASPLSFSAGTNIPLTITSASISSGAVLFYSY
jgi:hypothetical protein